MDKRSCTATTKRGERCRARAVERGLCAAHAGLVDMRAIGKKGGSRSPLTKLRKAADDDLREQARETLSRALRGEDVPKQALDAARSLFSYRADSPPVERREDGEYAGERMPNGKRPVSLGDVLAWAMANESTRGAAEAAIAQAVAARPDADDPHPAKGFGGVPSPSSTGTGRT
jgi:hypothetical protein